MNKIKEKCTLLKLDWKKWLLITGVFVSIGVVISLLLTYFGDPFPNYMDDNDPNDPLHRPYGTR